jgi:hypothetical protein
LRKATAESECRFPRDGNGDARTILRALARPGHRLHLQLMATRPGSNKIGTHQSPSMKPPSTGWYNQMFLSFLQTKPWGGKDPVLYLFKFKWVPFNLWGSE